MIDADKFKEELQVQEHAFNARLKEIKYEWKSDSIKTEGRFFYLSFKNGEPTIDEFIEYLYSRLINFCIPVKEQIKAKQLFLETDDYRHIVDMNDKARDLFVKSKKLQEASGEPGELITFILLEEAIGAPQVACKMYLKTNRNMQVYGSDGIHLYYDKEEDMLKVIWGESKIYDQLSMALDKICESISSFRGETSEVNGRERDIQILKDHLSVKNKELEEAILKYFDPYEEESNKVIDCHACFVGFDYAELKKLEKLGKEEREKYFSEKYLERIKSACNLFEDKIKKHSIHHLEYIFFLIPFKDVNELREKFYRKLGISGDGEVSK